MEDRLPDLAEQAVQLAKQAGKTVGTAESLTAGLIAATLADISGASAVLMGGIISYDPKVKHELLGVSQTIIDGIGVVSEPCARQMALGARNALHVDIALSATGVAGPTGGTEDTPVGTVYIGCAAEQGVQVQRFQFMGNRQAVRQQTVASALAMLIQTLEA